MGGYICVGDPGGRGILVVILVVAMVVGGGGWLGWWCWRMVMVGSVWVWCWLVVVCSKMESHAPAVVQECTPAV